MSASREIAKALRHRGHTKEQIEAMPPASRFDEYCQWHGLLGWGPVLRAAMEAAKELDPQAVERVFEEPEEDYK